MFVWDFVWNLMIKKYFATKKYSSACFRGCDQYVLMIALDETGYTFSVLLLSDLC